MKIQIAVSWIVTPYSVVVGYQYFRAPCCLLLQDKVKIEPAWSFICKRENNRTMEKTANEEFHNLYSSPYIIRIYIQQDGQI
jgi:hypothetical protein